MLLDIAREQAWYSFRRLNAFAVEFFGGFITLFLIMYQVVRLPFVESVLWGLGGYVTAYGVVFAGRLFWAVNKKMGDLREELEESAARPRQVYPYEYRFVRVHRELSFNAQTLDLDLTATAAIRVRSHTDSLPFVRHGMGVGENKAVKYRGMTLAPKEDRFQRDKGQIDFARTQNTDVFQRWRVIFTPGLARGEEATYEVAWSFSGARFLSFEEFSEARGRLELPTDKEFDTCSRSTPVPCQQLLSTVQFPRGYPIRDPCFGVKKAGHVIQSEMERLKSQGCFRAEQLPLNGGWKLVLDVGKPVTGIAYLLQWKPPDLNLLIESGFLTDDDRSTIMTRFEGARVVPEAAPSVEKDVPDQPAMRVTYRAYVAGAWLAWVSGGEIAGTTGKATPMEALQVRLINAPQELSVRYRAHVQDVGWMGWDADGATAGTVGKGLRLEAVRIVLDNAPPGYHIKYQAHVEAEGWVDWRSDGEVAGTTEQSRRMEAIRIHFTTP